MTDLFDMALRRMRRDRAARQGFDLFLHRRAFEDGYDRLSDVARPFDEALLIGAPDPSWISQLGKRAGKVVAVDPSALLAEQVGGRALRETDIAMLGAGRFDLVVAAGTLHAVDALPQALLAIERAMRRDALFIGTIAGGDSLPALRAAMRAADQAEARGASAHVHPRIEASALATLLTKAGFTMPVVDVDRVSLRYNGLNALVRDLRAMGETNILSARDRRPFGRRGLREAEAEFARLADGSGRTIERVDLLHFACWTPAN